MFRHRSTALALALGLLVGLALAFGGQALARSGVLATPVGRPPAAPTFPPRVVDGPSYEGADEVILDSVSFTYNALIRAYLRGTRTSLDGHHLLRHRSLELPDFGVGDGVIHGEPSVAANKLGLVAALVADAQAKGWEVVPELTVDAGVVYQAVGLRQGRWLFLVLGYGDVLAPGASNPGVSMDVASEVYACCEGGLCPAPPAPGLASCPLAGFVPVLVWTNLPRAAWNTSLLHPDMEGLEGDDAIWRDPPIWEEHVARATGG